VKQIISNPYIMGSSPLILKVVEMFRKKYYKNYIHSTTDSSRFPSTPHCRTEMFNDIMGIWWEANGKTEVFTDRALAKYVRRMWRSECMKKLLC
jgi:hypothetical protein